MIFIRKYEKSKNEIIIIREYTMILIKYDKLWPTIY